MNDVNVTRNGEVLNVRPAGVKVCKGGVVGVGVGAVRSCRGWGCGALRPYAKPRRHDARVALVDNVQMGNPQYDSGGISRDKRVSAFGILPRVRVAPGL